MNPIDKMWLGMSVIMYLLVLGLPAAYTMGWIR